MKTTKLTRTLLTGMMTCTMALTAVSVSSFVAPGATQTVLAADEDPVPETFTLNLHKLKVLDGSEFPNTGNTIPGLNLPGLPGVEFEIYNITKEYYAARDAEENKGLTNEQLAKKLSDAWKVDNPLGTLVTKKETNEYGIISHELDTKTILDGNKVHSVYMFVELEGKNNTAFMTARPFLLGMSDDLARKSTVHMYAKNYGVEKDLLGTDPNNEPLKEGYYSYNVGDELHYTSTSPIPTKRALTAEGYTGLRFFDQMSHVGTDLVDIDDIYYEDTDTDGNTIKQSIKKDFELVFDKITSNDAGWVSGSRQFAGFEYKVDWSDTSNWSAAKLDALLRLRDAVAGKKLHFSYTMVINKDAKPYESIGNTFYGYFTNMHDTYETVDDAPKVETGGHKFEKKDDGLKQGLNNAEFKISKEINNETKYAKLWKIVKGENGEEDQRTELKSSNGIYKPDEITWVDKADATTIISGKDGDKDGQLAIYGLETGTYQLVETKAPTGYTFTKTNTEFTVEKATSDTQELESETVVNYRNTPILPITGGIGIISFLAVGAMAMGGALYYKKKKA